MIWYGLVSQQNKQSFVTFTWEDDLLQNLEEGRQREIPKQFIQSQQTFKISDDELELSIKSPVDGHLYGNVLIERIKENRETIEVTHYRSISMGNKYVDLSSLKDVKPLKMQVSNNELIIKQSSGPEMINVSVYQNDSMINQFNHKTYIDIEDIDLSFEEYIYIKIPENLSIKFEEELARYIN